MSLKKMFPFFMLLGVAVLLYVIHKMVFYGFNIDQETFHYSLETLYLFFFVLSAVIFKVLLTIRKRSFDNVGMSFLLATSIKMIFCYLILRPLLQVSKHNDPTERINFFILFIVFLTIETLFTIRLVNEKQ
ncbi:magnesium-transporting ATPase (P-type) [Flavobacterium granuli]|uniref:Magnesium-transporting ATPase (P-type) n=1 Tax=Flavobacterium granuli TaxID=280093 RepID=A0ABU1S1T0_9FLAO|nr:magnesium-transporting ATPase (P-type) [Flavobacterium granuli]